MFVYMCTYKEERENINPVALQVFVQLIQRETESVSAWHGWLQISRGVIWEGMECFTLMIGDRCTTL